MGAAAIAIGARSEEWGAEIQKWQGRRLFRTGLAKV